MPGQARQSRGLAIALAAALLWAGPAQGEEGNGAKPGRTPQQVAISGIIEDASDSGFRLNYGGGTISVDMTGWPRYAGHYRDPEREDEPLFDLGDDVTVSGMVDNALYRARRLEALSVYVHDRDSFYTVAAPRNGDWSLRPMPASPLTDADPTTISLAGQVSAIAGDELSLDLGGSLVSVDTAPMSYDPLDDIGAQRVRKGDWVQVSGRLRPSFFSDRRLGAQRITSVHRMQLDAL